MRLIVVHQIFIISAIALAALFGLRAAILFARGEGTLNLGLAIASAAVGCALAVYLRSVRAKATQPEHAARGR